MSVNRHLLVISSDSVGLADRMFEGATCLTHPLTRHWRNRWRPFPPGRRIQKKAVFLPQRRDFFRRLRLAITQILPAARHGAAPAEGGAISLYQHRHGALPAGPPKPMSGGAAGQPEPCPYTLASFTSLMPNAIGFGLCQLVARFFLIASGRWPWSTPRKVSGGAASSSG